MYRKALILVSPKVIKILNPLRRPRGFRQCRAPSWFSKYNNAHLFFYLTYFKGWSRFFLFLWKNRRQKIGSEIFCPFISVSKLFWEKNIYLGERWSSLWLAYLTHSFRAKIFFQRIYIKYFRKLAYFWTKSP